MPNPHTRLPRNDACAAPTPVARRDGGAKDPTMESNDSNTVDRTVVICVSPGINGTWDVSEKGFEEPLASFDEKEDAYAYATELMRSKERATVLVEDEEGFSPLPVEEEWSDARNEAGGWQEG
ncbi:MAG TPA: hypothetical protein VJ698_12780 [Noviherbaspirillum sp.]|uniref:DUF2188 domain-containing protein n=1 Tax=Noviherbaspirillum sp. TaxID=1926288 RepID=UPI002B47D232|nr:hypothetical protein [Noviherbaspirillum sp.]HJV86341.1 hypothetical protein [Noviherbaspirillum sp.]